MIDRDELRRSFERAGVAAVMAQQKANRASGAPMQDRETQAEKWLSEKAAEAELAASSKHDARDEEALAIARDANRLAKEANEIARIEAAAASRSARYAMYAAVIAAVAAIVSVKDQLLSFVP